MKYDVIIAGGGAAGFFAAIHIAEAKPNLRIAILERGKEVLTKVKVSGGGRCNVTHAEFNPGELVKNYPRGEKELKGPFHAFCSGDTVEFFEKRGIELKIEEDGRMFPITDSSQTIIDCFLSEVKKLGVEVLINHSMKNISRKENSWFLDTNHGVFECGKLLIATGSNPKVWNLMEKLGHTVVPPVPSLFTFNIKDPRIEGLMGLSTFATVTLFNNKNVFQDLADKRSSSGPVLITHWGMSGPAILKLSAWGARLLHDLHYNFKIQVNWLHETTTDDALNILKELKNVSPKKMILNTKVFDIPNRLWVKLVESSDIPVVQKWGDVSNIQLNKLAEQFTKGIFSVNGKSTFKEEFVTAGGVDLKEINFKTYESKLQNSLYFAGEVLNIDAITGGFNFQNAWTGAYIAAKAIVSEEIKN